VSPEYFILDNQTTNARKLLRSQVVIVSSGFVRFRHRDMIHHIQYASLARESRHASAQSHSKPNRADRMHDQIMSPYSELLQPFECALSWLIVDESLDATDNYYFGTMSTHVLEKSDDYADHRIPWQATIYFPRSAHGVTLSNPKDGHVEI
jgi:hypothetical protein